MNSVTITIVAISLLTILMVLYFSRKNKIKESMIFSELESFANEYNCKITLHDHWNNSLIGLDDANGKKLFFINKTPKNECRKVIDLSTIKKCTPVNITRTVGEGNITQTVIDRVKLVISPTEVKKPEVSLEFYNNNYDALMLTGELQLAQKWAERINSAI